MINSLTIRERITALDCKIDTIENNNLVSSWRARKGLLTDEHFNNMIKENNITLDEFSLGIKNIQTFDKKSKDYLNTYLVEQLWFKKMVQIFESHNFIELDKKEINTSYIFQIQLVYVRKELDNFIKEIKEVEVARQFVDKLIESFYKDLMSKCQGVIIEDLHSFKKDNILSGITPNERYRDYILRRFCNKEKLIEFFMDYPAFTRLIFDRTEFFIRNYKELILHFNEDIKSIKQTFNLKEDVLRLNDIETNSGDSHGGGKSVSIVTLNNLKLVYKPKNLLVAKKLREIQLNINKLRNTNLFYVVKGIYRENYTIEEVVNWTECTNELEVKNYYRNFGELIAFAQIFKGNDLHYENIIAIGEHPVVVDLETFFQGQDTKKWGGSAYYQTLKYLNQSVLFSGLLPNKHMHGDGSRLSGIELSALSGDMQEISQRAEQIKNIETDEMKIEPTAYTVEGKANIPKLKGEKISYWNYREDVISGIQSFYKFILEKKPEMLNLIKDIFGKESVFVRNVLKGTQNYSDYLRYSTHPSCMKDMVEREKVLENLWAVSYYNLQIVKHEVQELIQGDVPLFISNIHEKNLYTTDGIKIENALMETTYECVCRDILDLSEQKISEHVAIAKISLGYFEDYIPIKQEWKPIHDKGSNILKNSCIQQLAIEKSKEIAEHIIEQGIYGEDQSTVSFIEPKYSNPGWKLLPMDNGVYDGLSGLYIYFHDLGRALRDERYIKISKDILNTLINQITFEDTLSGYAGRSAILIPLLREYRYTRDTHWVNVALEIVKAISNEFEKDIILDWITGITSLIPILEDWVDETGEVAFVKLVTKLNNIIDSKIDYGKSIEGLGHSHVGALMSIKDSSDEIRQDYIIKIINKAKQNLLSNPSKNDLKVCNGILGSLFLLTEIDYCKYEKDILEIVEVVGSLKYSEDSLCHGNAGIIDVLLHILVISRYNDTVKLALSKKAQEVIKPINEYSIRGISPYTSKSLFSGLAGIGHILLRFYSDEIVSAWNIRGKNSILWRTN